MSEQVELTIRLSGFISVLVLMGVWELVAPCRPWSVRKAPRWASHLTLQALNVVLARLLIPVSAVGAATLATNRGWGLLHLVDWPAGVEVLLAVLAFDLAIYLQHVLFHAVPLLWRLHMVHHADLDFDVTTGLRFHTLEILLSALIKLGVVLLVGPAPVAVVLFEVLLNATAMFSHSNVRLPPAADALLRWFVVTPDMHRVHHSVLPHETNSNFGFNLPWWDYLLGTYRPQPRDGHERMTIGLAHLRDEQVTERLLPMLTIPLQPQPNERRSAVSQEEA